MVNKILSFLRLISEVIVYRSGYQVTACRRCSQLKTKHMNPERDVYTTIINIHINQNKYTLKPYYTNVRGLALYHSISQQQFSTCKKKVRNGAVLCWTKAYSKRGGKSMSIVTVV